MMLSDDTTYSITSEVTDGTTATYTHTLTVTGRVVGQYQCSVSNIRTPSGITRSLTVVGKEPLTQHNEGVPVFAVTVVLPVTTVTFHRSS